MAAVVVAAVEVVAVSMMVAAAAVVFAVSILWARSAFHERVFEIDSLSSGERNG